MTIKRISFYSVDRKEDGTICKCCGAWIKNVCVVDTEEEGRITLGSRCYEKQIKSGLNNMQTKKINNAIKGIKMIDESINNWQNMSEAEYEAQWHGHNNENHWSNYEDINSFEEYRASMIEVLELRRVENENILKKFKIKY